MPWPSTRSTEDFQHLTSRKSKLWFSAIVSKFPELQVGRWLLALCWSHFRAFLFANLLAPFCSAPADCARTAFKGIMWKRSIEINEVQQKPTRKETECGCGFQGSVCRVLLSSCGLHGYSGCDPNLLEQILTECFLPSGIPVEKLTRATPINFTYSVNTL